MTEVCELLYLKTIENKEKNENQSRKPVSNKYKNKKMLKSFEKWTYEELDLEFGYERVVDNFVLLEEWLRDAKYIII